MNSFVANGLHIVRNWGLYEYQEEGVKWMLERESAPVHGISGGIQADEVGLGKTVQTLAVIYANPQVNPTLICVPSNLINQWEEHCIEFLECVPIVVHSKNVSLYYKNGVENPDYISSNRFIGQRVVLCTYSCFNPALVNIESHSLFQMEFSRVVYDEAHRMKDLNGQIAWNARQINAPLRWCLTGTPVVSKRIKKRMAHDETGKTKDLVSLFSVLLFKKNEPYVVNKPIAERMAEDSGMRSFFMIRRLKADVLVIPEPEISFSWPELSTEDAAQYGDLHRMAKAYAGTGDILALLMAMKMFCATCPSKIRSIVDTLQHTITPGSKVLIFCNFREEVDLLRGALESAFGREAMCLIYDGRVSLAGKIEAVNAYTESKKTTFMIMHYKSGGLGLNLHMTKYVITASPNWSAADELQAIGRAHRTQTKHTVQVIRVAMADTLEQFIQKRQESKLATASFLMDDEYIEHALDGTDGTRAVWDVTVDMFGCSKWD
jgi:SNF2 family DNA or RNA helicase